MSELSLDDIDLTDMDRFAESFPHEWFTVLRREAPVWFHQPTPEIMESQAAQAQMGNMPPPEDPNEEKRHSREMEKMTVQEKLAQSAHGREKEKMRLSDVMANRDTKRQKELMRTKDKSASQSAKLQAQTMKEKARYAAPAAKKTAAKKPAPKKGGKK